MGSIENSNIDISSQHYNSYVYTNIKEGEVYVGFIHIKKLQSKLVETIIEETNTGWAYLHLQDFIERANAGLEQLNTLISIGAFHFTGKTKKQLSWEANFFYRKRASCNCFPEILY